MKILFISRAYPPVLGGIENQNYEIGKALSEIAKVRIISNAYGKKFLPVFFPYALCKAFFLLPKYDILLLGDGVLGVIGWLLKIFHKKPVISIVHGLDLTYELPLYQKLWVGFFIKKLDKLIAVGHQTIKEGVIRKIPEEKFVFIPNGVDAEKIKKCGSGEIFKLAAKEKSKGHKIILTLGRLAKRKGVAWFINNVMPQLNKNIIYLIAGKGEDKENIKEAIIKNDLQDQVKILRNITDEEKLKLYSGADIFVQPNIKIKGDMEGFGLVVLEAAACEIPVLASNLEGLQDAIQNGKNGFLVKPYDSESYKKKIEYLLNDDEFRKKFGQRARQYVIEKYSWKKIAERYLKEIKLVIDNPDKTSI